MEKESIEFVDRREEEMISGEMVGLQLKQLVIVLRAAPAMLRAPSTMIAPFLQ